MFAQDEPKIKLSKITSFNRYLYAVLVLNLLIYTVQANLKEGLLSGVLITICWVALGFHAFINEVIRQILKKSIIATPEVCLVLAKVSIVLTAILISAITFGTGNSLFLFLFLIPVFHSLFSAYKKFSKGLFITGVLLIVVASITGWSKSSSLIINIITQLSIMVILGYLGVVLSSQAKHNSENASLLHNMATTDALTGLLNRREFNRRISEEIARAKRHKSTLCLALFDIDFFKKVNDNYGHAAGDQILRELGELMSVNTRNCDISARYGGEEFALILPETGLTEAYELLERLRVMVERQFFYLSHNPIRVTISVGVAQYDFTDSCAADLCERADKALYQAKRNGRNRVEYTTFSTPKLDLSRASINQVSLAEKI